MQQFQCPRCNAPVAYGAQFCQYCGNQFQWQQQQPPPPPPPQQQPPNYQQQGNYQQQAPPFYQQSQRQQYTSFQHNNTSGSGKDAVLPPELEHWNWGAFLWVWIWGLGNNVWISLLTLIPLLNYIFAFVLGAKGNKWAWQNKRWDNIEHFQRTQKAWKNWGIALFIVSIVMIPIFAIASGSGGKSNPSNSVSVPTLSVAEIKNSAQSFNYDDLMRNNKNYIGKIAYYRGEISNVIEMGADSYEFPVSTKKDIYLGYLGNTIYVHYKGLRMLQGDTVDIWGRVDGLITLKGVLGNEVTVPELTSLQLELIKKTGATK
jgi:hypothetical protein